MLWAETTLCRMPADCCLAAPKLEIMFFYFLLRPLLLSTRLAWNLSNYCEIDGFSLILKISIACSMLFFYARFF